MLSVATIDTEGFVSGVDGSRLRELADTPGVIVWADLHEPTADEVSVVAEQFSLHPLALEDALEARQRPKLENYPAHTFLVAYAFVDSLQELAEVDVFLGHDWLVTVRNPTESGAVYDPARLESRIVRQGQADPTVANLLYSLLDDLVDAWLDAMDHLDDQIDLLENQIFLDVDRDEDGLQRDLLARRRELLMFRRRVVPMRDVLSAVTRHEVAWLGTDYQKYFEDVLDHVLRIIDLIDLHRELLGNAFDAHLAMVSNRMNRVMKTMTAGGSIVLGATLIAGIYGMNFDTMPELHWAFGYPVALASMALLTAALFVYFRRRNYL